MGWNKDNIKALRKKLGLSQMELAQRLGCRQQTVSEWEQGIYEPANAYGKLLTQFENQNFLAASTTSWLPSPKEKGREKETKKEQNFASFENVFENSIEEDFVREFDPAID